MDELTQLREEVAALRQELAKMKQGTRTFADATLQVIGLVREEMTEGRTNLATNLRIRDLQVAVMNLPV